MYHGYTESPEKIAARKARILAGFNTGTTTPAVSSTPRAPRRFNQSALIEKTIFDLVMYFLAGVIFITGSAKANQ
jgi:hypothetical protein